MAARQEEKRKTLLREARGRVEKGAHGKAALAYEKALAIDPSDLRAMRRLGDVYVRLGRKEDARRTYLRVADGHERRGMVLMAVGALKAMLAIDPMDAEANDRLATCYVSLGLAADATRSLSAAAEAYESRGDASAAIKVRRQLNAFEPDNLVNALRLAELLGIQGDSKGCLATYNGALRQLRLSSPGSDTFLRVAERILELAPDDVTLMREVAEIHLERGDTSEVARWLDQSHGVAPSDPGTLGTYAKLFEKTGRTSELRAVAKELARVSEIPPPAPLDDGALAAPSPPLEEAPPRRSVGGLRIRMDGSGPPVVPPVSPGRRRRRRPSVPPRLALPPGSPSEPVPPPPLPIAASGAPPPPLPIAASGAQPPFPPAERPTDVDPEEPIFAADVIESVDASTGEVEELEIQLIDCIDGDEADESCDSEDDDEEIVVEVDTSEVEVDDMVAVVQQEVDRLLHGVEVLLEFDAVDKAVEVSLRALELAPSSERARALHRLALYRSGAAEEGDGSATTPGRSR